MVLAGLDDVDWAAFDGAYGPCTEAPDILRAVASPDPETADEGRFEIGSSFWHQGTVYPVTPEVVPFLVELAATPGVHQRDHLLCTLGGLCDPDQVDGAQRDAVRAAVAVHSGPFVELLADPDPRVRAAAAYALAWAGPHGADALEARWAVEEDPAVRAALLPGLAMHDRRGAADRLRAVVMSGSAVERLCAAHTYTRLGLTVPAEAMGPLAEAFGSGVPASGPWFTARQPLEQLLRHLGPGAADALVAAVLARTPDASQVLGVLESFARDNRAAAANAARHVRTCLGAADPHVRAAAARAAYGLGEAAAGVADALAAFAERPDAGQERGTAVDTLVRLGHPAAPALLAAVLDAGAQPRLAAGALGAIVPVPFDGALLAAVRRRLADPAATRPMGIMERLQGGKNLRDLVELVASWGPAAAAAVPELRLAWNVEPTAVPAALAAVGAVDALPALRERARGGDVSCGHAVLRLTGDPADLLAAARAALDRPPRPDIGYRLRLLADAGPAAAPLLPTVRSLVAASGDDHDSRRLRVHAARLEWSLTGDAQPLVPVLRTVLRGLDHVASAAAELLAEFPPESTVDAAPLLRTMLAIRRPHQTVAAAHALRRLGAGPDELAGPLLDAAGQGSTPAVRLLVALDARDAAPALAALAAQERRVVRDGGYHDLPWEDDRFRRVVREAVAALGG
ncbi:hypothetical protein Val02_03530 [Virgisporangium aliadipatigenens]|uniref:HEAT repeat domain-containing protein n=1 Tax=Virgisporangium aliadipatigenens TaxID=741659 RepID=A0A8J4DNF5_9ACTN|nr:HEAT repeat domain-containing protein [Virgisporangium aliadipatigenens]GIJ43467.1 hypothetical protein Val02_03530 [Virgisporangium aliadipatigenens]